MKKARPTTPIVLSDRLLTILEAATLLGLGDISVRRMIRRGELPVLRLNRNVVRIRYNDLQTYLQSKAA